MILTLLVSPPPATSNLFSNKLCYNENALSPDLLGSLLNLAFDKVSFYGDEFVVG